MHSCLLSTTPPLLFCCPSFLSALGGLTTHNISTMVRDVFVKRLENKKPFPHGVVFHANSDQLSIVGEHYETRFEHLMKFLRRHVPYIVIIGPGLFTPLGEIIEHWDDSDQFSTIKVIRMQERACKKVNGCTHINFR